MPKSILKDHKFAMIKEANPKIKGSPWTFKKYGKAGIDISSLLPHTAKVADELCVIRSIHTDTFNHGPAISFITTGDVRYGRPTMGAWLSYGLGSLNENLPAFVAMTSYTGGQPLYDRLWGAGFLSTRHQGGSLRSTGDPVLYLSNPEGVNREVRRGLLDDLKTLNQLKFDEFGDPEIATRIAQYELAYRMQSSVPNLVDVRDEPDHVFDLFNRFLDLLVLAEGREP